MATIDGNTFLQIPGPSTSSTPPGEVVHPGNLVPSVGDFGEEQPPVFTLVSPPEGVLPGTRAEARRTPITVRVTDNSGVRAAMILVRYVGDPHVYLAYDTSLAAVNEGFVAEFFSSDRGAVWTGTTQLDVTLLPVGGWPGDIEEIRGVAYDTSGNIEADT